MRLSLILSVIVLVVLPATASSAATAVVDAEYTLNAGESATYEGGVPEGVNTLYYSDPVVGAVGGHGSCTKNADSYCDHLLVELVNPVADDGDPATDLTAKRTLFTNLTTDAADYDLVVYASDSDATIGTELGTSARYPFGGDFSESVTTSIVTRESAPSTYVLVRIIYYAPTTPVTVSLGF